jgi:uncharacterized protein
MPVANHQLRLSILPGLYAICRFSKNAPLPDWALQGEFVSITRTADELSIVCNQTNIPDTTKGEKDWRCLKIAGTLDFSLTGILASLATPLAEAGISIFAISTFDTDYLLIKENTLEAAIQVLTAAGHLISR